VKWSLQYGKPVSIPQAFYDVAPSVLYWGYEFQPNSTGTFDIVFAQKYDASSVVTALLNIVGGFSHDGCSHFRAHDAHVTGISLKRIDVAASVSGKQRACTDVFGTEWNTDIGDISGSASGSITFRTEAEDTTKTGRYRGAFLANNPTGGMDAKVDSIFGINANSVVGQIVIGLGHLSLAPVMFVRNASDGAFWEGVNIFDGGILRIPDFSLNGVTFVIDNDGRIPFAQYRSFISGVTEITWSVQPFFQIDDARTGLSGTPSSPVLTVAFGTTAKKGIPIDTILQDVRNEISLIKSFGEDPQSVVVSRGDTLWKIALAHYGSPYFASMLAAANGKNRLNVKGIRAGQTITLPPIYQLTVLPQIHFMAPGETVSEICRTRYVNMTAGRCLKQFQLANPGIPMSGLYALEALRIPPSASER